MSVLTADYERLQNLSTADNALANQYRNLFANQNIGGAQALINQDNAYLLIQAKNLNDLVDTINYMQQIWANDKTTFALWVTGMLGVGESHGGGSTQWYIPDYNSGSIYHTGGLAKFDNLPYFCIEDNTTGEWDDSKWILLKPNEMGITIGYDQDLKPSISLSDSEPYIFDNISWIYNSDVMAETRANIRYCNPEQSISGEIYITPYVGEGV